MRSGACSPCEDCSPAYKAKMLAEGRCDRPETLFFTNSATFEMSGVCADDPGFARVLKGQSLGRHIEPVGQVLEVNIGWAGLLRQIRRRASREVKLAIDIWLRQFDRGRD